MSSFQDRVLEHLASIAASIEANQQAEQDVLDIYAALTAMCPILSATKD